MRFLFLVIDTPSNPGTSQEMVEIDKFNDSLKANGQWIFAWGLHGADHSQLIDNRAGLGKIDNTSLVKSEENYSGFWLIDAESPEQAQTLALEASRACNRKVELRPLH